MRRFGGATLSLLDAGVGKNVYMENASRRFPLTDEQRAAVACQAKLIRVVAFAGAGKTTMLVEFARARRAQRFLYLAYNASIQKEASKRFPPNVVARTSHSLAYEAIGHLYAAAGMLVSANRMNTVMSVLDVDDWPMASAYAYANACMDTLNAYLCSDQDEMTAEMVPSIVCELSFPIKKVLESAQRVWSIMRDLGDTRLGMTHDGYLKLYQLSKPGLAGYDYILFDEAQDANPVTAALVLSQDCGKVLVGDRHQQIYTFRGARDALDSFEPEETFYLTTSFRFGAAVAQAANALLSYFKGESHRVIGMKAGDRLGPVDTDRQYAIISRTNSGLFDEAVAAAQAGKKLFFVGGIDGYKFASVADAYHLMTGDVASIRDPYLKSFKTFAQMEEYAEVTDDKEAKMLCKVVGKYGNQIPQQLERIYAADEKDQGAADICLTTAHKSKGLEFEQVRLADDFVDLVDKEGKLLPADSVETEEINILYVACTRAECVLEAEVLKEIGASLG